jgi:hypothetical protein
VGSGALQELRDRRVDRGRAFDRRDDSGGQLDPVLGRSYVQIAREGWGEQKSQNGGANPTLSGPAASSYHLWAVAPEAAAKPGRIRATRRSVSQQQGQHRHEYRRTRSHRWTT